MDYFEYWIETDLQRLPPVNEIKGRMFTQDSEANLVGVIVTNGGEPINLSGSVSANIILPNGETITVAGDKSQNKAWVILPDEAYELIGNIGIFIKLTNGSEVSTLGGIEAFIYQTST